MNETDLRQKVLIPLFRAMGYCDVFEYHGGPLELGKDIVMWKEGDLRNRVNYGVVVKAKKITGTTSGSSSAADVMTQIGQTLSNPYKDPVTTNDQEVDRCFVVCPCTIKKETFNAIQGLLKSQHLDKLTDFLHGDMLWKLIEENLPERTVVAQLKKAHQILDQVSPRLKITPQFGKELSFSFDEKYPGALQEQPFELSGQFEFPNTPDGQEAVKALQNAIATGAPVKVPQEFVKTFQVPEELKTLFGLDDEILPEIVEMKSEPTSKPLLLRIEMHKDGKISGAYEYVDLRAVQAGTDEITYTNRDQPVPFKLTMTINRRSMKISHSWAIHDQGTNVHIALQASRFHEAIAAGGEFQFIHIDTGRIIGQATFAAGETGIEPQDPYWLHVLEELEFIQRKTNLLFDLPENEISIEEAEEILTTAFLIRGGRGKYQGGEWSGSIKKKDLAGFFENWPPGTWRPIRLSRKTEIKIFGTRIDMGEAIASCDRTFIPKSEAKRCKTAAKKRNAEDLLKIKLKPYRKCPVNVEYPKWLPEGESPSLSDEMAKTPILEE